MLLTGSDDALMKNDIMNNQKIKAMVHNICILQKQKIVGKIEVTRIVKF